MGSPLIQGWRKRVLMLAAGDDYEFQKFKELLEKAEKEQYGFSCYAGQTIKLMLAAQEQSTDFLGVVLGFLRAVDRHAESLRDYLKLIERFIEAENYGMAREKLAYVRLVYDAAPALVGAQARIDMLEFLANDE